MNAIKFLNLKGWRLPAFAFCPVNAIDRNAVSIWIGARLVPGQDATGATESSHGRLGTPLVQNRGLLIGFTCHIVQGKVLFGNDVMHVSPHPTICAVAIEHDQRFRNVALKAATDLSTVTANLKLLNVRHGTIE